MPRRKSERMQQIERMALYPLDWLEERSGLIAGVRYFLFRKVPGDTSWWHTLGSATLTAFLVQLATGLFEGLTGYLLPYDQTAYWATVVAININGTAPFVGPFLASLLRGGAEIGPDTLARFYSLHMLLVPGALLGLIGLHLYLVVRLGVSSPPWSREAAGGAPEPEPPPARSGLVQPRPRAGVRGRPE